MEETLRQAQGDKKFNEVSVLFPILTLYTIAYIGLMIYDFVAKEKYDLPTGMMAVYVALLGAYAADKEIRRWVGSSLDSKFGSIFVYAWLVLFLAAYIVASFKPEYVLPNDLLKVALEVIGIFFGSKVSKKIYDVKTGKELEKALTKQETVMKIIKEKGEITRGDVMEALKLSRSTAGRMLEELEKKNLIKQTGEKKGARYLLAN